MAIKESSQSGQLIITIFAVLVVLIFLLYKFCKSFSPKERVFLLTGLSGSGKTALFAKLVYSTDKKTVISMKENKGVIEGLNVKLIDIPGADRLRQRYWEEYRNKASHIIFVLDATDIDTNLREICEYLYLTLSYTPNHKRKAQYAILCNKMDLPRAKKPSMIKALLERELNGIKQTKSGQLEKTSRVEEDDYLNSFTDNISLEKLNVRLLESSLYSPGGVNFFTALL